MNLFRSLSRLIPSSSSSSVTRKWSVYRTISFLQSSSFSTEALNPKPSSSRRNPRSSEKFPRPSEIPFQAKVVNSVHLVGTVGVPVQLQTLPNGIYAVSVLVQEKKNNSPHLWIPVIFQGDLAQIAACHLKENDLIYVTGQLSGDVPALAEKDAETSSHVQVFVNTLNFVRKTFQGNEDVVPYRQDEVTSTCSGGMKEPNNSKGSLWRDLVENPLQWGDYRQAKLNGSVTPKYPDFRQKSTQKALWLDSAPAWVSEKLDSLVFSDNYNIIENNRVAFTKKLEKGILIGDMKAENLWKNLVENPNRWWDQRSNKLKPNQPDFKHKDTGEALWLGSSTPSWVLPKLPPLKSKQDVDNTKATQQEDISHF